MSTLVSVCVSKRVHICVCNRCAVEQNNNKGGGGLNKKIKGHKLVSLSKPFSTSRSCFRLTAPGKLWKDGEKKVRRQRGEEGEKNYYGCHGNQSGSTSCHSSAARKTHSIARSSYSILSTLPRRQHTSTYIFQTQTSRWLQQSHWCVVYCI